MHNGLRSSPEIQRGARRAFGLGIEDEGLERLGETLEVSADFWQQPDWRFLRGEKMVARGTTAAAVAAQFSYVMVNNPLGSGVIATIDRCRADVAHGLGMVNSGAAMVIGAAAIGPGYSRDTRWSPYPLLTMNSGQLPLLSGAVAALGTVSLWTSLANEVDEGPYIIHPGFAFVVFGTVVNTAVAAFLQWRERRAFPGELP